MQSWSRRNRLWKSQASSSLCKWACLCKERERERGRKFHSTGTPLSLSSKSARTNIIRIYRASPVILSSLGWKDRNNDLHDRTQDRNSCRVSFDFSFIHIVQTSLLYFWNFKSIIGVWHVNLTTHRINVKYWNCRCETWNLAQTKWSRSRSIHSNVISNLAPVYIKLILASWRASFHHDLHTCNCSAYSKLYLHVAS